MSLFSPQPNRLSATKSTRSERRFSLKSSVSHVEVLDRGAHLVDGPDEIVAERVPGPGVRYQAVIEMRVRAADRRQLTLTIASLGCSMRGRSFSSARTRYGLR
jgi:hypothetical protein